MNISWKNRISGGIKDFSFGIKKVHKMVFENVWEPWSRIAPSAIEANCYTSFTVLF